jgi:hypothetical protein
MSDDLKSQLSEFQIQLLEDFIDFDDVYSHPLQSLHQSLSSKGRIWIEGDFFVLITGSSGEAKRILYMIGAEHLLPELKVEDVWAFLDADRVEVINRIAKERQSKNQQKMVAI